jgi:hypothetical protein
MSEEIKEGGNGKLKEEQVIKTEEQLKKEAEDAKKPKLVMQVIMHNDGSFEMKTSLIPPMVLWVMEQVKYNLLKENSESQAKILQPPNGGIMNFARRFKR